MFGLRLGVVFALFAHVGSCGGGGCAHGFAGGSHGGFRAGEGVARVASRVVEPAFRASRPLAEAAAAVVDTGLQIAAAPHEESPTVEGGGGDEGPLQPPDILLCRSTPECGPGGACDLGTQPLRFAQPPFARSAETVGLCRPVCRGSSDCLASERCVGGVDPAEAAVSACVPGA